MEKKLTNSGPLREPADKHSIYTLIIILVFYNTFAKICTLVGLLS